LGGSVKEGTNLASTVNTLNGDAYVYFVNSKGELADFFFNGTWTKPTRGGEVASGNSSTAVGSDNQWVYYRNRSGESKALASREAGLGPLVFDAPRPSGA
jgi:hypothetical protein